MHRKLTYLLLFAVLWLVQAFLLNNLTLSIYFHPLIGIVFVLLLPLETPRGVLLLAGLASGLADDWALGSAGVDVMATVFTAFFRPVLLGMLFDKENIREGGIPSPERLGAGGFLRYLLLGVTLHHLLFFLLASLSWTHLGHTLLRLAASVPATAAAGWIAARLLTSKLTVKL